MPQKTIIDLFEENEREISKLYMIYSKNFRQHEAFWTKLSKEELSHARDTFTACDKNDRNECFKLNKFAHNIIRYVNSFVKKQIGEAQKNNLSNEDALNIALRVERSMIENKNFELFTPSNAATKKILQKINKEADRHIEMIMGELRKQ